MTAYATRDDVYLLGLSAQAFVVRPRPVDTATGVDITTGTIRLTAHGLTALDIVTLTVTSGGSLPAEYSAFTAYTPIVVTGSLFKLTTGTTPIAPLTSAGSGWAVEVDQLRRLDRQIEIASADFDEVYTAGEPPLLVDPLTGLYPQQMVGWVARRAALQAATTLEFDNPSYRVALDRIEKRREADDKLAASWMAGKPLNPRPTDQNTIADNGARALASTPVVGWYTGGLT